MAVLSSYYARLRKNSNETNTTEAACPAFLQSFMRIEESFHEAENVYEEGAAMLRLAFQHDEKALGFKKEHHA